MNIDVSWRAANREGPLCITWPTHSFKRQNLHSFLYCWVFPVETPLVMPPVPVSQQEGQFCFVGFCFCEVLGFFAGECLWFFFLVGFCLVYFCLVFCGVSFCPVNMVLLLKSWEKAQNLCANRSAHPIAVFT